MLDMDRIAYLKGLLDGLDIDKSTKEGKIFLDICDALDEIAEHTKALEDEVAEIHELCDLIDDDLTEVEDFLYEDDDECCGKCGCDDDDVMMPGDDGDFSDDDMYEVICPTCGEEIFLDEDMLEEGSLNCPSCGEPLEFDVSLDEEEETE
ncbi:MAG: hypothetical protein J6X85_01275 [Ruminococcus sp.]|nr:hypothetical protein [Ruminococcus sp.]